MPTPPLSGCKPQTGASIFRRFHFSLLILALLAFSLEGCAQPARRVDAAHGERLARALGCSDCRGSDFSGHKVSHNDQVVVLYSANLTRAAPNYSDAQLKTVLTTGVRPDGTRLWQMDAAPYAALSEGDMADLVAYLRTLKPVGQPHPRIKMTPTFSRLVLSGQVRPESETLAQDLAHPPVDLGPDLERGRYLARTVCAGCHAPSLRGFQPPQPGDPPDLAVVGAYSRGEFQALIHRGRGRGGRDVGEMGEAARKRLADLPAADVDALYAYLSAWSKRRPPPQN